MENISSTPNCRVKTSINKMESYGRDQNYKLQKYLHADHGRVLAVVSYLAELKLMFTTNVFDFIINQNGTLFELPIPFKRHLMYTYICTHD